MFVAVFQKALSLLYVDELLQLVKAEFTAHHYKPNVSAGCLLQKVTHAHCFTETQPKQREVLLKTFTDDCRCLPTQSLSANSCGF